MSDTIRYRMMSLLVLFATDYSVAVMVMLGLVQVMVMAGLLTIMRVGTLD